MKTLNLFIFTKDRELQLKALLDSFFKHSKTPVPLKITIFYDDENNETWFHRWTFAKYKNEILHFNLVKTNFDSNPPVIENYFVQDEFNLVLPDNTIFTQDFHLSHIKSLNDDEILDLYKGLNRQKNSVDVAKSKFLTEAGTWKREGYLYNIEKYSSAFEQIPQVNHFKYYGKIFVHNAFEYSQKKIFFYPISPCFINGANTSHPFIDFYDVDTLKEYNPYAFSIRYSVGEIIDIDEMNNFSPNSLMYQYLHKFKKDDQQLKLHDLVSHALYINLDHRTDRKELIEKEIEKLNLIPLRIPSVIPSDEFVQEKLELFKNNGRHLDPVSEKVAKSRTSCTLSHLKAVQHAKDNDWDFVLILEDDCMFLNNPLQNINAALEEIHRIPQFDILHLGANVVIPTTSVSTNLAKVGAAWCMHAYILPKHMYDTFLNFPWEEHLAIDSFTMTLQSIKNTYIVCPFIATQRPSYSDIVQDNVDYTSTFDAYFSMMLNKNPQE